MEKFNLLSEKTLEQRRKDQNLDSFDKNVNSELSKEHTETKNLIAKDLEGSDEDIGHKSIESMLNNEPKDPDVGHRTGKDKHDVLPYNLLNSVEDLKREKAFNKSVKKKDGTVDLDNVAEDDAGKISSQLQNHLSRFKGLTLDDVKNNKEIRQMVYASLKDSDQILYNVYKTAFGQKRILNKEELDLVNKITDDKIKILTNLFESNE